MSKYWQMRKRDLLYNQQLGIAEKQLSVEYIRCFEATKSQLMELYDEILDSSDNGTLLVSDLYKYNRYYDLLNNLNMALVRLGNKEIAITEQRLANMYRANFEVIGKELKFETNLNDNDIKQAINSVWCQDGRSWSDRIWTNKTALEAQVQKGIVDCIARGSSREELTQELMHRFNVGFNCADRLARTELAHTQVQSTLDKYREAGVTYYKILNTHDDRTCEGPCEEFAGKIFRMDEAVEGVNLPPFHPNCRCTILAVLNKEA